MLGRKNLLQIHAIDVNEGEIWFNKLFIEKIISGSMIVETEK